MPLLGTKGAASAQGFGLTALSQAVDAYFEYVTMLLPGNGTNGAQNNTFLDSSTNNFTITRNGNTTQGTFTPYGSNWSNWFDGNTTYLSVPDNAAFNFGSGNFTIELWFNQLTAARADVVTKVAAAAYSPFVLLLGNTLYPQFYMSDSGAGWSVSLFSSTAFALGTWNHLAVVRNGTTITMYLNGVSVATQTGYSGSPMVNSSPVIIGGDTYPANGYLSNVRIVKGVAVYNSAFTPSATPLTTISGTSLLTCQSNRFVDNSSNAFAITVNGPPSVQRFSPFNPTAPYAVTTIGGSGYFDGSGDNLAVISAGSSLSLNGNFTIEFWVYRVAQATNEFYVSSGSANNTFRFNNSFGWYFSDSGNAYVFTSDVNAVPLGAYNHLAFVRSGSSITMYVNGVSVGSVTYASTVNYSSALYIAGSSVGVTPGWCNAYISNLRIVNGTAVYTANFTPPTAPLTAIANTQLLLSMTNSGIIDNAMMNDLETVGNAQISTAVSKFGSGSISFPGSGYLSSTAITNNIGGGNFTIEMFVNFTNTTRAGVIEFSVSNSWLEWSIGTTSYPVSRLVLALGGSYVITSTSSLSTGTFHHIAIVRNGTTVTLYQNGVSVGSTVYSSSIGGYGTVYVGTALSQPLTGYIDDLRITNGYARYTGNFTPPTQAFPTF